MPFSQSMILVRACLHATAEYTRRVRENSMYYLYEAQANSFENEIVIIQSELGIVLTQRLLTYAQPGADRGVFYGFFEEAFVIWISKRRPANIKPLATYVEPGTFTRDEEGKYWSLLSEKDARLLHKYWKSTEAYTSKEADKQNYFKNAVDHFEHMMEKRWSK